MYDFMHKYLARTFCFFQSTVYTFLSFMSLKNSCRLCIARDISSRIFNRILGGTSNTHTEHSNFHAKMTEKLLITLTYRSKTPVVVIIVSSQTSLFNNARSIAYRYKNFKTFEKHKKLYHCSKRDNIQEIFLRFTQSQFYQAQAIIIHFHILFLAEKHRNKASQYVPIFIYYYH